jgi:BMFP domain-containing protein YqiC
MVVPRLPELKKTVKALEKRIAELEAKFNQNSQES